MKSLLSSISTASTPSHVPFRHNLLLQGLSASFVTFWLVSFFGTTDIVNWWIENILVILFAIVLVTTYRRFKFSDLSYLLFFVFLVLHTYGAKYAYADNPLGFHLQQAFHLQRNPYDRIVHTSFGLLIAYPIRDLLMNRTSIGQRMLWLLPVEVILSLAGLFELVEWSVADVFLPGQGQNYVGSQGDVWDAQKDMIVAVFGAILTTCCLYLAKKQWVPAMAAQKQLAQEQY